MWRAYWFAGDQIFYAKRTISKPIVNLIWKFYHGGRVIDYFWYEQFYFLRHNLWSRLLAIKDPIIPSFPQQPPDEFRDRISKLLPFHANNIILYLPFGEPLMPRGEQSSDWQLRRRKGREAMEDRIPNPLRENTVQKNVIWCFNWWIENTTSKWTIEPVPA